MNSGETGRLVVQRDGPVQIITIDRPPINSLNASLRAHLRSAFERAAVDGDVRVVVLTGEGSRSFCAGQDFKEDMTEEGGIPPAVLEDFDRTCGAISDCAKPTIAAVNGSAIGGGLELALSCDLRLAAGSSTFGAVSTRVGLVASTQRLPRVVGEAHAKWMLLTAAHIGIEHALRIGLIHEFVQEGTVLTAAVQLGQRIAQNAPEAVSLAKQAIEQAWTLDLQAGMRLQQELATRLSTTSDHIEAMRAARAKEVPRFQGKGQHHDQ